MESLRVQEIRSCAEIACKPFSQLGLNSVQKAADFPPRAPELGRDFGNRVAFVPESEHPALVRLERRKNAIDGVGHLDRFLVLGVAAENYGLMGPVKAALDSSLAFLAKSFSPAEPALQRRQRPDNRGRRGDVDQLFRPGAYPPDILLMAHVLRKSVGDRLLKENTTIAEVGALVSKEAGALLNSVCTTRTHASRHVRDG